MNTSLSAQLRYNDTTLHHACILLPPSIATTTNDLSSPIIAQVAQTIGCAACSLPDGSIVVTGGERPSKRGDNVTQSHIVSNTIFTYAPEVPIDHQFDDAALSRREVGPYTWKQVIGNCHELTNGCLEPPHGLLEHSMAATRDMRVVVYGGRFASNDVASAQERLWIADYNTLVASSELGNQWFREIVPASQSMAFASRVATPSLTLREEASVERHRTLLELHRKKGARTAVPDAGSRQCVEGRWPGKRYGHSATMVCDSKYMLIAGGRDERGVTRRDMHFLELEPITTTENPHEASGCAECRIGKWQSFAAGRQSGSPLSTLPVAVSHHVLVVRPLMTAADGDEGRVESWVLVVDGCDVYMLDVRCSPENPTVRERMRALTTEWRRLAAGGLYRSMPRRIMFAAAFVTPNLLVVHGGARCAALCGSLSAAGDVCDVCFKLDLQSLKWSFSREITDRLGPRYGHHFQPLLPPSLFLGNEFAPRCYESHWIVVGGCLQQLQTAGSAAVNYTATLSVTDTSLPCGPCESVPHEVVLRSCSATVSRSALNIGLFTSDMSDVVNEASNSNQPSDPIVQKDIVHRIRESIIEQEQQSREASFKGHIRGALLRVMHSYSSTAMLKSYFGLWKVFACEEKKKDAVDMCVSCKCVPCEVLLLPCRHFALCGSCASCATECPLCGKECTGTESGFRGHLFPRLHRFLAEEGRKVREVELLQEKWSTIVPSRAPLQRTPSVGSEGASHEGCAASRSPIGSRPSSAHSIQRRSRPLSAVPPALQSSKLVKFSSLLVPCDSSDADGVFDYDTLVEMNAAQRMAATSGHTSCVDTPKAMCLAPIERVPIDAALTSTIPSGRVRTLNKNQRKEWWRRDLGANPATGSTVKRRSLRVQGPLEL